MMKKNFTELVFILDRSGSMSGLESDTIGGYNGLLKKQRSEVGEAVITTVLFDDRYELLHDRINIKGVVPLTDHDYYVRGCTALLDAVGKTIAKIENAQKHTAESERPEKTLFVITTDGMENASREFTKDKVKTMVERMKEEHGWELLFLGANIDSVKAAGDIGICANRTANYHADSAGTALNFEAVDRAVSHLRACRCVDDRWSADIKKDYKSRKNKPSAKGSKPTKKER